MPEMLQKEMKPAPFGTAKWLTFGDETEAVIAEKTFDINDCGSTVLTVCGLGFCEIYINGKNAAERLCAPAWTNYLPLDTAPI